jgi:hypothetical protein
MINPAFDVWVWAACGLFLVLMATRSWLVETRHARLGRTTAAVKLLSGSTVVTLAALAVLLTIQGGKLLVDSIVTKTDPAAAYYANIPDDPVPVPAAPAAPAAGAPAP